MAKSPEEADKDLNPEPPNRTYSKRTFENRADGGPVTRSSSMQLKQTNGAKISYVVGVNETPANNGTGQANV